MTKSIGTLTTLLSTELNALAIAGISAAGTVYDNRTNLYDEAELVLDVTFASAPTAGTTIDVYFVIAVDDTNYSDGGTSVTPPGTGLAGSFPLRAVTTAQRVFMFEVELPQSKFKLVAVNNSGVAFPASGSTIKMSPIKY